MTGFLRVFVVMVMMLVSMASGAWAATCSETTSFTSVGTFTKTFENAADGFLAGGTVPITLAPGDRISNLRAVWSVNGGRTVNSGLFARLTYPGQSLLFLSGPSVTGLSNGSTDFVVPSLTNSAQSSINVGFQLNSTPVSTTPPADGTTVLTAEIFVQCVPAPLTPTTTTVSSAPNPSTPGQNVVLTANVAAATGTPAGTVQFFDDGNLLGSSALSGGAATFTTTTLASGPNIITAVYAGAAGFATSTSIGRNHIVFADTTTTLTSTLNPSLVGQSVTFTALVRSNENGTPVGSIEFRRGTTVLATVPLNIGGGASFTTSFAAAGTFPITAVYLSSGLFLANESAPTNQVVNALPSTTNFSKQIDDVQEAATGVAATLASDGITDSVAEEIGAALSGQVQVLSASEGKVGLVYAPGIGKGTVVTPTADLATGETSIATWRIWTSLRYTDFDSSKLEGDQINALLGTSFLFGDGLTAGLVAGYERQDYEDSVNATLKGQGFNIGGYAGGTIGDGIRFDAQVHTSFLNYDIASGPVTADTDAKRLIVSGGFAHMMQFGATTFEPTARFNGTWEWQDGYTDSVAVAHGSKDFNFGRIATGAKLAHRFDLGDGATFSPFVTGYADYRFSGGDTTNESLMDGLSARVGLGAQINTASGITTSVLGEFSGLGLDDNVLVQSYKAQLSIPF